MTDIGATLREARMRRRLDITEVEQATKIRAKYLRAMEDEEWELLPGPTFVKSFLRTYADYLGLDSRLLIEEWKRANERVSEQDLAPMSPRGGRTGRERPREPGRWGIPAIVVGVLVVLLGALYLLGRNGSDNSTLPPPRAGGGTGTTKKSAPAPRPRPTRVKLTLTPTAPVYVCLVNGAGKRLLNGVTLQPSSGTRSFTARRLLINLGNSSVTLRVNGRPVPVGASGAPIGIDVTPKGHKPLAAGQRPTCA